MWTANKCGAWTSLVCLAFAGFALPGAAGAGDLNALLENCAGCHGKDGISTESDVPIIGGYSATYLTDSLTNYRNKARPCPDVKYRSGPHKGEAMDMCTVAGKLGDPDIKAIADYLAGKPFVRARQTADAAKAERGRK
ncbi:MAG: c-type cytochrome, partial [Mycobacterium sp.]